MKINRAQLAADEQLGTGNVLTTLIARGDGIDEPVLTFDTPVDQFPAWHALSLRELDERVRARTAALRALGIAPRDPVAVYTASVADQALSFLAMARLGAIPALINGRLDGEIASRYIQRLGAVAVLVDDAHRELLAGRELALREGPNGARTDGGLIDVATLGSGDPDQAGAAFQHNLEDPVVITHSSGTTGLPKAVGHSHRSLFASVRHRLSLPKPQGLDRMLSVLPPPHAAMVIALNLGLSHGVQLAMISRADGEYVLDAIEKWQPQTVLGFSTTWSQLAELDLSGRRLDSVRTWWNTGDCAHESHIRRLVALGSRDAMTRQGLVRQPGSVFVDGLGSTEMGHSQFFISHTPDSDHYGRCIGKPHAFSKIAVFDEHGEQVPAGEVGQLGVSAPTVAMGYWNDSVTTWRTRLNGYFLTGDLVYRDEEGYYYHVDRLVDSVDLGGGKRLYTMSCEEKVLAACPDVVECTVVAVRDGGEVSAAVLLVPAPGADAERDRTKEVLAALDEHVAAVVREVVVVDPSVIPLGATGKVRKIQLRAAYLNGELPAGTATQAAGR